MRLGGIRLQYGMCRLNGYGRVEAAICIAAKRLLGTKLYYYGWKERRRIRRERLASVSKG